MDNPQITNTPPEQAQLGWESLAHLFNTSLSTAKSRRHDLRAAGVIWDHNVKRNGWVKRTIAYFPSVAMQWVMLRGRL